MSKKKKKNWNYTALSFRRLHSARNKRKTYLTWSSVRFLNGLIVYQGAKWPANGFSAWPPATGNQPIVTRFFLQNFSQLNYEVLWTEQKWLNISIKKRRKLEISVWFIVSLRSLFFKVQTDRTHSDRKGQTIRDYWCLLLISCSWTLAPRIPWVHVAITNQWLLSCLHTAVSCTVRQTT